MGQGPKESKKTTKLLTFAQKEQRLCSFFSREKENYQIEVFSDLENCFCLWKEFSPQRNLFETWEFRLAFYFGYQFKPYFLVAKKKGENLALLPLWFDEDRKIFTWFGSDWQEENYFWYKEKEAMETLLKVAPSPLYLNALTKEAIEPFRESFVFQEEESKYLLDLRDFKTHEDWLKTLKKNDRRDMRKDRNRILRQNPKIIINQFSDFKNLVKLAKERFKEKGENVDWEDPRRIKTFEKVIELGGKSYIPRMISVKIGEKYAGVDLIVIFKERYYTLKCGYNVKEFKGIGNFINLLEIDDAIHIGLKKIDFLQNSYHWKSRWFPPIPLFKFQK